MCWFQFSDTLYQTDQIVVCSLFAALWQVRNLNLSLSYSAAAPRIILVAVLRHLIVWWMMENIRRRRRRQEKAEETGSSE